MELDPLIPSAWEAAAGAASWVSPLPSELSLASGEVIEDSLRNAVTAAWGEVTGSLMATTAGAWGVDLTEVASVVELFQGDAWKSPATWVSAGATAATLVMTGLGVSAAVIAAVPIVGAFVGAAAGAVAGVIAAVSAAEDIGRPTVESRPPSYSREADESWCRQLMVAARSPDQQGLWTRGHGAFAQCYHPAGVETCDWGVGVSFGMGVLVPGSGYWPGSWCTPKGEAMAAGVTRPSAAAFASVLEATYLGNSGAIWCVDAPKLESFWVTRAMTTDPTLSLPGQPRACFGGGDCNDLWPAGSGEGSYLVKCTPKERERVAKLFPGMAKTSAHGWPLYRRPPSTGPARLQWVRRARADFDGELWMTRAARAACTCQAWAEHQARMRLQSDAPLLGVRSQPGFREDALAGALARGVSPGNEERVRDPALRLRLAADMPLYGGAGGAGGDGGSEVNPGSGGRVAAILTTGVAAAVAAVLMTRKKT